MLVIVLDSNEYIFSFGLFKKPSCERFLNTFLEHNNTFSIRITRTIFNEVRANLTPEEFKEFILFINTLSIRVDEDSEISFELGSKYEAMGLKPADAFIAAYAEFVGADMLISENRHFLSRHHTRLSFKICNAETCLKFIKSSHPHLR